MDTEKLRQIISLSKDRQVRSIAKELLEEHEPELEKKIRAKYAPGDQFVSNQEIAETVGRNARKVGRTMKAMGYKPDTKRIEDKVTRGYYVTVL